MAPQPPGNVATVTIEDRSYSYTVQSGDTLDSIRDALVELINQDPKVTATASGVFDRILLTARVQGPDGNGIVYGASADSTATVIMTAIGTSLCCAAVANTPVTHGQSRDARRDDLRVRHRPRRAGADRRQSRPDRRPASNTRPAVRSRRPPVR